MSTFDMVQFVNNFVEKDFVSTLITFTSGHVGKIRSGFQSFLFLLANCMTQQQSGGKPETVSRPDPFKNQRGFPSFISRSSIEKQKLCIEWAPGETTYRQFKVSEGLLLLGVPPFFQPPLEYGDYLLSLNGETLKDLPHFKSLLKQAIQAKQPQIVFEVERVIATMTLDHQSSLIPEGMGSSLCEYLQGTMIWFPRAALGLGVKSVEKKVFVESTDNGFNSIGRRVFFIGDVILSINGQPCHSVAQVSDLLRNSLKENKMVTVVLERAVEMTALQYVKVALQASKQPIMDPKMQDDVVDLCKDQLKAMKNDLKNATPLPPPILKEDKKKSRTHVEFSRNSKEMSIGMDLLNPNLLSKVPSRATALASIPANSSPAVRNNAIMVMERRRKSFTVSQSGMPILDQKSNK